VRLKSFLEMRGADGGPTSRICALPALWVGLLYDQGALDAAWDLVKGWTWKSARRCAMPCPSWRWTPHPRRRKLRDIAREVLDIAHSGLRARNQLNAIGDNETGYLAPLDDIVARGKVPAEALLERFHGEWGGDLSRIYDEKSFRAGAAAARRLHA
jgi:glutamate--cysteine ligase